uniref:Uncharacterized protein n=1 Tax=Geospiza parvula TaxID=87175 RepID=A0A8U8B7A3_GEOPR
MGQKVSQEDNQENEAETLVICEVFSQGVLHASQRLKDYLGFVDPQSKFQPATNTLSKIFLLAELFHGEGAAEDCCREAALADECFQNTSRFEKLAQFCRLVGRDCLGLFVVFGVPGKPKDIRGILLDSVAKEKQKCRLSGRSALRQFVTSTDSSLPTEDMLENCLGTKKQAEGCGQCVHKLCVSSWAGAAAPCSTGGRMGLSSAPLSLLPTLHSLHLPLDPSCSLSSCRSQAESASPDFKTKGWICQKKVFIEGTTFFQNILFARH